VENKSGRIEISAKTFIDASGDCDLARRSGVATNSANNALTLWHMEYNKFSPDSGGDYFVPRIQVVRKGQIPSDQNKKTIPADQIYHGLSGSTVSDFILRGRKELRQRYQKIYSENRLNRQNCFAVNLPLMAQFRKTYCIRGTYTLTSDDWGKHFSDSIGLIADWRTDDRVWEIPYSSLLCPEISNLLTVGRCCSAIDDAWEITRVIPAAALTGEAAGVAAFCAFSSSETVKNLDLKILQEHLKQGGTPLHLPDLNLNYKNQ
jgi:hypothetical protein